MLVFLSVHEKIKILKFLLFVLILCIFQPGVSAVCLALYFAFDLNLSMGQYSLHEI